VSDAQVLAEVVPMISPEVWRDGVVRMRNILVCDDVSAARDVLRERVDVVPVLPGKDSTYVELAFPEELVALRTGTGSRIPSGSAGAT
jgi:hypothetical protein